ncbi:MAG: hypothetical protein HZA02_09000 [Nitrospinae bacterium]|nr:hypothetical protein [Nitrospinota bacterium]
MDWSDIKYFTREEFRPEGHDGDFDMGIGFILKLDNFRSQIDSPMVVHKNGGFAVSGHSENSLHYLGLAADLHIRERGSDRPRDVLEQALLAYKWSFLSIGIYPFWNRPGLHLDDRAAIGLPKKVWFQDRAGKYRYYPYEDFHRCVRDLIVYRERMEKAPEGGTAMTQKRSPKCESPLAPL